jgi:hypothetical protein
LKKIVLIVMVLLLVGGVAAFADHPSGLGIGVVGGSGFNDGGMGGGDVGLSLKIPSLPVYWGINLRIDSGVFGIGATGDYYLFDEDILNEGELELGWFLGVGGFANVFIYDAVDDIGISFGARLPIGLSLQFNIFELFLDIAPSLGAYTFAGDFELDWRIGGELGFRVWL